MTPAIIVYMKRQIKKFWICNAVLFVNQQIPKRMYENLSKLLITQSTFASRVVDWIIELSPCSIKTQ